MMRNYQLGLAGGLLLVATTVSATETVVYTYDALGRLVTASTSGSVNNGIVTSYAHDSADNRQTVVVTGASH